MSWSRAWEQNVGSPEGLRYAVHRQVAQAFRPAVVAAFVVVAQGFHLRRRLRWTTIALATVVSPATAAAQTPVPAERVTFDEAIRRAVDKNPSAAIAAAGILRAEALMMEARSAARLQINGSVSTTTLNKGVEVQGATVTPQNQLTASLDVRLPLYAPARWARTAQAGDAELVQP